MKARVVDKSSCELGPGELRRVPQNSRSRVVGYHLACPACGFVTMAVNGDEDLVISEGEQGLSFSRPVDCLYCETLVRLDRGELTLVEDGDVHRLPSR